MHGEPGTSPTPSGGSEVSGAVLARLTEQVRSARDVDGVARGVLASVGELPDVTRAALALSEGGGRRLRFVDTQRAGAAGELEWCHVDAYDDVPLTTAVRTGTTVCGNLDGFGDRYAGLVDGQRATGVAALAAVPLPGTGSPAGGLLLYFGTAHPFDEHQVALLEAAASRASEAVRRLRLVTGGRGFDATEESGDPDGALTVSLLLEGEPRATGAARRFLREHLREWDVDDEVGDDAQLCLSELVTNAVVHAGTAVEVRVVLDGGQMRVAVRDLGGHGIPSTEDPPPSGDPDPLRVHGRGLQLVDALSDRWGSERDATGTRVWFAVELDRRVGAG